MFYGFSVLLFVLAIVTGIPAVLRIWQMRKIRQNSATATGMVKSAASSLGWLMSSEVGGVSRPLIIYKTPDEKERMIEVIDGNAFKSRRYTAGDTVEVVYEKNTPWQAYVKKEWNVALRDLWMACAELLVSIILWNIGLALKLPI